MLQAHHIKKEPTDSSGRGEKHTTVCTCKKKRDEDSKTTRQVLVNFGLSRKKVFTLNGKVGLHELFTSYVLNEPAFSGLLKDSYVVFQEFNAKFGTWVDIDQKEDLQDGAVLTAVFFPQSIERDDNNPGSIRKRKKKVSSEVTSNKGIVEICLSDVSSSESEETGSTSSSQDEVERNKNNSCTEPKRKKPKKGKTNEDSKEVNEQQLKNVRSELGRQKKKNSFGESHLKGKPESPVISEVGNSENSTLPSSVGSVIPDAQHTNNSHGRAFAGETPDQNGGLGAVAPNQPQHFMENGTGNPVDDLERYCSDMKWPEPIYDVKKNENGYTCRVLLNDNVYLSRHTDFSSIREFAAEKILCTFISSRRKPNYSHRQKYRRQPHRGRHRYTPHR